MTIDNGLGWLLVIDHGTPLWRTRVRASSASLLVRRRGQRTYQRPMIATDLRDPKLASAALQLFDFGPHARVSLVTSYRIPFQGLRALPDTPRLERAMEARTREQTYAFIRSSELKALWLDIHIGQGDARDHAWREVKWGDFDLAVLAFGSGTFFARSAMNRLVLRILDRASCDVAVIRNADNDLPWRVDEQLVAL